MLIIAKLLLGYWKKEIRLVKSSVVFFKGGGGEWKFLLRVEELLKNKLIPTAEYFFLLLLPGLSLSASQLPMNSENDLCKCVLYCQKPVNL